MLGSDSNKRRETLRQTLQSFQSSQLRGRRSELEEEKQNAKKSLRASLAGCEINERLVNKFGSVKAILSENERMEKAGLFVIHPYSNFRFAWDMFTLAKVTYMYKLLTYLCNLYVPVYVTCVSNVGNKCDMHSGVYGISYL